MRYLEFGHSKDLILLIARILLVALFLIFGLPKIAGFSGFVGYMTSLGAPLPTLAAGIAVFMEVIASLAIMVGFYTRPLALIFVFYTLGTALMGHAYWSMTGDAQHANMINFYKNISIIGGFLLLTVAGPGRFSLDKR